MKLKKIAGFTISLLLVLSLFSCAKKEEKGIVTLRWISDPNPVRWEQIKRFEEAHPGIKINLDWSSSGNLQKILVQTAGGKPPDVFDCNAITLRIFAEKGAILDITEYCKRDNVNLDDIWENCHPSMYYKDRIYAIPTGAGTTVLFYNKKLFDKEGISYPDYTWTWDRFLEVTKRLTRINPEKKYYECFGTGTGYLDYILPWQYGADLYSEDGKSSAFDSEGYKRAYRFMYDLVYKYHVSPTQTEMGNLASEIEGWGQGDINLFSSQRLSMIFCGRYATINFRRVKDLEWGVAPVPYPAAGGKRVTFFGSRAVAIASQSKHREEAFEFLKFLLTRDYNEAIASGGDGFPAVKSLAQSDFFLYNPAYPEETQNKIFIEAIAYSKPFRLSPYFNQLEVNEIQAQEEDKMWAGIQSPEETLDNIAQKVNKLVKKKGEE